MAILPNLIVIGAGKCGTTSLHYYLSLHPEIQMSEIKELNFFTKEDNWDKGVEWYKSHFKGSEKIHGETSPRYTLYPTYQGVPERMHSLVPDAKLVYILRDPIEKIRSSYVELVENGIEKRPFLEVVDHLEEATIINSSRYYMQIEQYLKYYPKSNLFIITTEDLLSHREETLQQVFRFLEVQGFSSHKFSEKKYETKNKTILNRAGRFLKRTVRESFINEVPQQIRDKFAFVYRPFEKKLEKPVIDEKIRNRLAGYLKKDTDLLRKFTGRNFENWSV